MNDFTLPGSLAALNRILGEYPLDLARIAERVARFPVLARRIRRASPRANLEEGIISLGSDGMRLLIWRTALSASSLGRRWCQTARLCCRLARANGYPLPQRAYLAGLIYDLGRLPLIAAGADPGAPIAIERRGWGFDHCQMGAWLGRTWNFPPELVEVMEHHHQPERAMLDPQLVALVAAADEFAHHPARIAH